MIECASPAIFLADCHLPLIPNENQSGWTERVVEFLQSKASESATVVLVGDIFDFWFEWKHSVPSNAYPVLFELSRLSNMGIKIFYLAGNHDGHPGKFLADKVGLTVVRGHLDVEIDNRKFHFIHGDGIAPRDVGYRMLRALVRWRPTEGLFRMVHPDWGIKFAAWLSKASQDHFSAEDKFGLSPYKTYAFKKIDNGFDYVVMGHRHATEYHPYKNGAFLGIGGWIADGGYGIIENGEAKIEHYS